MLRGTTNECVDCVDTFRKQVYVTYGFRCAICVGDSSIIQEFVTFYFPPILSAILSLCWYSNFPREMTDIFSL